MSNPADDFRHLLRATKIISSALSLEEQLPALIGAVIEITGADKAMFVLRNEDGSLVAKASRPADDDVLTQARASIEQVFKTAQPLFEQAADHTTMITPLVSPNGPIGVLYARTAVTSFDAHKKEIFVALSEHAAVALNNARLFAASVSDPMTRLYNHAYCLRRLREEVERAQRYGRPLSFVLIDVDKFKSINDGFGHRRGDEVIRSVAQVVAKSVRTVDVAARYGGDELALILPETEDGLPGGVLGAKLLAERIRARIANLKIDGVPGPVTASIGVAAVDKTMAADMLVERADQALYAAKHAGRNCVRVYGENGRE